MSSKDSFENITLEELARMVADGFANMEAKIDGAVGKLTEEFNGKLNGTNNRIDALAIELGKQRFDQKREIDAIKDHVGIER